MPLIFETTLQGKYCCPLYRYEKWVLSNLGKVTELKRGAFKPRWSNFIRNSWLAYCFNLSEHQYLFLFSGIRRCEVLCLQNIAAQTWFAISINIGILFILFIFSILFITKRHTKDKLRTVHEIDVKPKYVHQTIPIL